MGRFSDVLFDLDGTVTDPFDGIAGCIRHAMRCMGLEPPSGDEMRGAIGPPLRQTFGRLLASAEANRIEDAMRLYRERYSVTGLFENEVYPGLPDLLANLNRAGCRLFLATSKPSVYAQRIVDHFELGEHFAGVYGSELDGRLENKSDLLRFLLDKERLKADATAMVGDRGQDIVAAKTHSLSAVGVTWGYGSSGELAAAGADVMCSSPAELFQFLTEASRSR
jgi:phosphoglycolate phosphatase